MFHRFLLFLYSLFFMNYNLQCNPPLKTKFIKGIRKQNITLGTYLWKLSAQLKLLLQALILAKPSGNEYLDPNSRVTRPLRARKCACLNSNRSKCAERGSKLSPSQLAVPRKKSWRLWFNMVGAKTPSIRSCGKSESEDGFAVSRHFYCFIYTENGVSKLKCGLKSGALDIAPS